MESEFVVHCQEKGFDIYIGRRMPGFQKSKWENPFRIGTDGTREEVVLKYLFRLFETGLIYDIRELEGKILGCWCKSKKNPKLCHGDILALFANTKRNYKNYS